MIPHSFSEGEKETAASGRSRACLLSMEMEASSAHHGEHGCSAAAQGVAHNLAAVAGVVGQGIAQRLDGLLQQPARACQHSKVRIPEHHARSVHNVMWLAGPRQACEHVLPRYHYGFNNGTPKPVL